jgi:CHAT domain-containing protein
MAAVLLACACSTGPKTDLHTLIAASGGVRQFAGRFAGMPFAAFQPGRPSVSPEALAVMARAQSATSPAPQTAQVMAAGSLLMDDPALAETWLSADTYGNERVSWMIDLSAVYLAAAARDESGLPLARAIDTAAHASEIDPSRPEAWFNLALALELAGLNDHAARAWNRASDADADPQWRTESIARRDALVPADSAGSASGLHDVVELTLLPQWARGVLAKNGEDVERALQRAAELASQEVAAGADSLHQEGIEVIRRATPAGRRGLARAHLAYADGLARYEANDREGALAQLDAAIKQFDAAGSPFAVSARAHRSAVLYGLLHYESATRDSLAARDQAKRLGFRRVRAEAEWVQGVTATERGDLERALLSFQTAIDEFTAVGATSRALRTMNSAADTLREMGHETIGWTFLRRALNGSQQLPNPRALQVLRLNASLYAEGAGLHRAARLFQDASIDIALARNAENAIVEGHIRRARLALAVGDVQAGRADLDVAARRMTAVRSAASRRYLQAWLESVSGEVLLAERDPSAAAAFDRAITTFRIVEPTDLPRLYLMRGRAERLQSPEQAAHSFRAGINELQQRLTKLNDRSHRVSYLDEGWDLYDELIDLEAASGRYDQAFAYAEEARLRSPGDAQGGGQPRLTPDGLRAVVPADGALLYFTSLRDRLLLWTVRRDRTRFVSIAITSDQLASHVAAFRTAIESAGTGPSVRQLAAKLFASVIGPAEADLSGIARVVIVPDGALHAIPFAALLDGSGAFLGERYAISTLPSAALLRQPSRERPASALTALLVGAEAGVPERGLRRLPEVARELSDLKALYGVATTLTTPAADARAWKAAVPGHGVMHFAGHAIANTQFPDRSELVLGRRPNGETEVVTASEITNWPLAGLQVVTLSACQTAYGALYRGEGLSSLARWFLAAGVPTVVSTLWEIRDDVARMVIVEFHRAYVRSQHPAAALQTAQRTAAGMGLEPMLAWSSFQVSGGFD